MLFLAYTGARWGEMAAMRAGRIDFLRRRASIVESVTVVKGRLEWGTPKDHERRDLPLPRFLTEALAAHVAGKDRDELVFTGEKGGVLRAQVFQRAVLTRAASSIDVEGLHPHELRHTAASLAIASGANIKVVQTMLGHESATMTLDLYGHLFPDQLDELADAFDFAVAEMRARRGPAADFLRTNGELRPFSEIAGTCLQLLFWGGPIQRDERAVMGSRVTLLGILRTNCGLTKINSFE